MSATNDEASSSHRPLPDAAEIQAQPSAARTTPAQRVFRVYKPLGASLANGRRAKAAAAKSRKAGFFADRFDRYV